MQWVWTHSQSGGADRLVLLAIADNADDDGGNAWPSIDTLAGKANVSSRTVQRCIDRLVGLGELRVERNAGGSATTASNRRPNRYTIVASLGRQADTPGQGRQPDTPTTARGDAFDTSTAAWGDSGDASAGNLGVASATFRGDARVTQTVLEPPAAAAAASASPTNPDRVDVGVVASGVVDRLRDRPPLAGTDLRPLQLAVVGALQRGCGPRALVELLAAAIPRAQTPGLLVRVAADATPDGCPPDDVLANRDAVAAAWQAGRDRMSIDHPDEHPTATVATLAERSYPGHSDHDRRLRLAFVAGWGGQPLTTATRRSMARDMAADTDTANEQPTSDAAAAAATVTALADPADGADASGPADLDRAAAARAARDELRRLLKPDSPALHGRTVEQNATTR